MTTIPAPLATIEPTRIMRRRGGSSLEAHSQNTPSPSLPLRPATRRHSPDRWIEKVLGRQLLELAIPCRARFRLVESRRGIDLRSRRGGTRLMRGRERRWTDASGGWATMVRSRTGHGGIRGKVRRRAVVERDQFPWSRCRGAASLQLSSEITVEAQVELLHGERQLAGRDASRATTTLLTWRRPRRKGWLPRRRP